MSGDFYCYDNKLVTLAHSPKYIGGLFDFSDNKIGRINIDNFPEFIGGAVFCAGNCVAIDKFNNRNRIEVLNELKKEKEDKELISFIDKEASKITKASRMKL